MWVYSVIGELVFVLRPHPIDTAQERGRTLGHRRLWEPLPQGQIVGRSQGYLQRPPCFWHHPNLVLTLFPFAIDSHPHK